MEVGHIIAKLREKNGISQKELAKRLNITPGAVGQWETNSRLPKLDKFVEIADFFSVSTDLLLQGDRLVKPENFITDINDIIIKREEKSNNSTNEQAELLKETFLKLNDNDKYILMGKAMELLKEETNVLHSTTQGKRA